jgi:hypothetical protein
MRIEQINFEKILAIGYNKSKRLWSEDSIMVYCNTSPAEKVKELEGSSFEKIKLDEKSSKIGKKFQRKHNISFFLYSK